jgi:broad specificity phosphatase PhoE
VHTGGSIDRAGVERWLEAYDLAGIQPGCLPPATLVRIAANATHIVTSDLPRAIESAERVARGRAMRVSDLLREASLAIPYWPTRLPLNAWAALIHLGWLYRVVRRMDADRAQRARASAAADMLSGIVADGSTVLVVTHGVFRVLLEKQFLRRGWTSVGRVGGYRHWSAWTFAAPAERR